MIKTAAASKVPSIDPDPDAWNRFFERAYLALLSAALPEVEVRNSIGDLTQIYEHENLTKGSDSIRAADEALRIEVLVNRCHRMAEEATNRFFEERNFNAKLNA